jgi:ADP-glucose pyrophosphorylase
MDIIEIRSKTQNHNPDGQYNGYYWNQKQNTESQSGWSVQWILLKSKAKHRIIIRMDTTMDIIEIRSKTQNHNPDGWYNGYYWNQKQNTESQSGWTVQWILLKSEAKHRIIIRMDSTMDIIEIRSKTQNHNPDGQYNGYYWNQKQNTESQSGWSVQWILLKSEAKHRITIWMDSTMDIIEIRSKTQNHNPDGQYNGYYWNQKQNTES